MKNRRLLSLLLALCMVFAMLPLSAGASETTITGSCGDSVTYSYDEASGTLTISGTGPMWDYAADDPAPWGWGFDGMTYVEIEAGVTYIGSYAFNETGITGVSIPDTVTVIGENAFKLSSIASITIPGSVTEIRSNAFNGCIKLTAVTIPGNVKTIGEEAFVNCYNLASLTLEEGVEVIEGWAFWGPRMSRLTIPSTVTSIGNMAFYEAVSGTITFAGSAPDGLKEAFGSCNAYVYYPESDSSWTDEVKTGMGTYADLTWVGYATEGLCGDDVAWSFDLPSGILTISGTGPMWDFAYDNVAPWPWVGYSAIGHVEIEAGVTYIGNEAFRDTGLRTVSIPDTVTAIGYAAFSTTDLESVEIPESVTELGASAFSNCTHLTKITIPGSVETIGESAFNACSGLVTVTLSEGVAAIGDYAFYNADAIFVTIPSTVSYIGEMAFMYGVQGVLTFGGSAPEFGRYALDGCTATVYYPLADTSWTGEVKEELGERAELTWMGYETSGTCGENLTWSFDAATGTLTISGQGDMDGYGMMVDQPWYGLSSLVTNLVIGDGVTSIGARCFQGLANLKTVTLADSVKRMYEFAFSGTNLTCIVFPADFAYVGGGAFEAVTGEFWFSGDAPEFAIGAFGICTATCYYPEDNATWTEDVLISYEDFGGSITWVGYKTETVEMFRLYNPNSGEHFYTANEEERDFLASLGWKYEGVAWTAPTEGAPVYRVYNPNSGDHHYTMNWEEVEMLQSYGWRYEGIGWCSADESGIPLYRMWNPNADCGSHHYSTSAEECDWLASLGWILEGIGWYGIN